MIRAVLDTNVIMSGLIGSSSLPAAILLAWEREEFILVASEALLAEYERVITYDRIANRLPGGTASAREFIDGIRRNATIVVVQSVRPIVVADPDDDIVLETAVAGSADYVVSGDRHLRVLQSHQGIPIVTPAVFHAVALRDT